MTPIEIPQEARSLTIDSERVNLPFDAPYFWWTNGNPAGNKNGSGVQFYGGWTTDAETLEAMTEIYLRGLVKETHYSRAGNAYTVYAVRYLAVAPIAKRSRWVIPPEGGKGSGHTQYLVMTASYQDKTFTPCIPAVLSVKGYVAMILDSVMAEFDRITLKARKQYAGNATGSLFWRLIGTFGKERSQRMVGKAEMQSPITPPVLFVPKESFDSEEALARFYVGAEVAKQMVEFRQLAQEWIDTWKQPAKPNASNDDYFPEPPMPEEPGDIPF